eukprot:1190976-Prorocentrum_minimum.AAC.2
MSHLQRLRGSHGSLALGGILSGGHRGGPPQLLHRLQNLHPTGAGELLLARLRRRYTLVKPIYRRKTRFPPPEYSRTISTARTPSPC